jgi:hypothetical protein
MQARIAFLGRRDEVVEGHPIGVRQHEQQLQGGPTLSGVEPRHRALGDAGGRRDTGKGHSALGAQSLEPGPDLLERGGDVGRGSVLHGTQQTPISR